MTKYEVFDMYEGRIIRWLKENPSSGNQLIRVRVNQTIELSFTVQEFYNWLKVSKTKLYKAM